MGDMGDYWRDIRNGQREERRARQTAADEALPRVREVLAECGVTVTAPDRHHWQFRRRDGSLIGCYWPSAQRFRPHRTRSSMMGVTITQLTVWIKKNA